MTTRHSDYSACDKYILQVFCFHDAWRSCGAHIPLDVSADGRQRVYCGANGVLLGLCYAGVVMSIMFHVGALAGIDWTPEARIFWLCQGILLFVYLPICGQMIRTKSYRQILEPTRWQRRLLWSVTAYYAASFYVFLYRAADHLEASHTWEMMSAGMLLAFSVAAVHYSTSFSRYRSVGEKRSGSTLPSS